MDEFLSTFVWCSFAHESIDYIFGVIQNDPGIFCFSDIVKLLWN